MQGASSQPVQLGQMSPSPFANSAVPPPQPVANGHHQSTLERAASAAQLGRYSSCAPLPAFPPTS